MSLSLEQLIHLHNELLIIHAGDDLLIENLREFSMNNPIKNKIQKSEIFLQELKAEISTPVSPIHARQIIEKMKILLFSSLFFANKQELALFVLRKYLKGVINSSLLRSESFLFLNSLIPIIERFLLRQNRQILIDAKTQANSFQEKITINGSFLELLNEGMTQSEEDLLISEKTDFQQISQLFDKYRKASMLRGKDELVAAINSYIIKYSMLSNAQYRNKVDEIIHIIGNRKREMIKANLINEVKSMDYKRASYILYKEMVQGIKKGDLLSFVIALAIYTRITAPYPEAPFKNEIDQLERAVYPIIEKKGLWHSLSF